MYIMACLPFPLKKTAEILLKSSLSSSSSSSSSLSSLPYLIYPETVELALGIINLHRMKLSKWMGLVVVVVAVAVVDARKSQSKKSSETRTMYFPFTSASVKVRLPLNEAKCPPALLF